MRAHYENILDNNKSNLSLWLHKQNLLHVWLHVLTHSGQPPSSSPCPPKHNNTLLLGRWWTQGGMKNPSVTFGFSVFCATHHSFVFLQSSITFPYTAHPISSLQRNCSAASQSWAQVSKLRSAPFRALQWRLCLRPRSPDSVSAAVRHRRLRPSWALCKCQVTRRELFAA